MNQQPAHGIPGPLEVIRLLVLMCFFKAKPQDLPASRALVAVLAFASVATNFASGGFSQNFGNTFIVATCYVAAFGVAIWVVLKFKNHTGRWLQTASAVYGTTTMLRLVSWPAMITIMSRINLETEVTGWPVVALAMFSALGIWSLAILMAIFREAMEVSKIVSFFVTVSIVLIVPFVVLESLQIFSTPTLNQ